jgi:vitamin B12 transporter
MRAAVAFLFLPTFAWAEPAIVVTGQALPQAAGAAAYGATVISADRLGEAASARLEDALKDAAGFATFRRADSRAANPTAQGATLRALGGNAASRTLVLWDGAPLADPFGGWIPWAAAAPETLGLVRVTRGGGAGPFGAGALAGVIELFSPAAPASMSVDGEVAGGSRDAWRGSAAIATPVGGGFLSASARFERGDGYRLVPPDQAGVVDVPARYRQLSGVLRAAAPLTDNVEMQARLLAFEDQRLRGLPGAAIASDGVDAMVRVVGRGAVGFSLLGYVQSRRFASVAVNANASRTLATPTLDQFNTPSTGWGVQGEVRPDLGEAVQLQLGADARFASGETNERFGFQNGAFTGLRQAGGAQRTIGVYAEASLRLNEHWLVTGGVRADHTRNRNGRLEERNILSGVITRAVPLPDRSDWRPTARGGLLFTPTPALTVRSAAYLGFRNATLNELYRPFRVGADATAANASLRPERLRGVEAGVEWQPLNTITLSVTGFVNRLEDAIANVTRGRGPGTFPQVGFVNGSYRVRENVAAIDTKGLEASASARLGAVSLSASYAYADPRVSAPGLELDGKRPAQSPQHLLSATARYTAPHDIVVSTTLRYTARQFEDDIESRSLAAALTVDATVRLPLSAGVALTASVENLFDRQVQAGISPTGVIELAGPRSIWIGLSFSNRP